MAEKSMPRKAVISRIAQQHGLTKTAAEELLKSTLSAIADELAERGRFHVAEVGSIHVASRKPRRYFNPKTREEAVSDGDVQLKINISKSMRERLLSE